MTEPATKPIVSPPGEGAPGEDGTRPAPTIWSNATWTELADAGVGPGPGGRAGAGPLVALLPVGAVEAHGPHLPVSTDSVIAEAAASAAVPALAAHGWRALVLPAVHYTAAPFAAGFPGTVSISPATLSALLRDIAESLEQQSISALVVVNSHLDPAHLASIREVAGEGRRMPVIHPDLTSRHLARRLSAEFRSGACHAGRYETSVVMAEAPALVRDNVRRGLPGLAVSLSDAIRRGARSFEDAGMSNAYCGDPADATAREGRETIRTLGRIVADAVTERMEGGGADD